MKFLPFEIGTFIIKDGKETVAKFVIGEAEVCPRDWREIEFKDPTTQFGYHLGLNVEDFEVTGGDYEILYR